MKKLLLLILVTVGTSQLHAQTLKPIDPQMLVSPKDFQSFKLNDSTLLKPFTLAKSNELLALNLLKANNAETFYSRMPVAKLSGYDKMPVVKPGDTNMSYLMPVKKVKVVDPLLKPQSLVTP
ncbi:MAG: hypothetical protein ACTHJ8_17330 [Mucilaginibacter sp.]